MGSRDETAGRIEDLRGILERLCAADLTLAEAKTLSERLSDLLEPVDPGGGDVGQPDLAPPIVLPYNVSEGRRHEARPFEVTMLAVG